jgi:four helix bundle protein
MKVVTDLDVYKLSEQLSDLIWFAYDNWSKKTQLTIGLQIVDASDSIAANISEGYGRYTKPDRRKFYFYARGSFEETKTWLRKLYRRKIISKKEMDEYAVLINELGPKLNGLINSTK